MATTISPIATYMSVVGLTNVFGSLRMTGLPPVMTKLCPPFSTDMRNGIGIPSVEC
jgi:hypothetical protein